LFVPLWSRSWQRQATMSPRIWKGNFGVGRWVSSGVGVVLKCLFSRTYIPIIQKLFHSSSLENRKHGLGHIKGVTPVVILDWSVILFYTEDPPAKNLRMWHKSIPELRGSDIRRRGSESVSMQSSSSNLIGWKGLEGEIDWLERFPILTAPGAPSLSSALFSDMQNIVGDFIFRLDSFIRRESKQKTGNYRKLWVCEFGDEETPRRTHLLNKHKRQKIGGSF